MFSVCWEMAIVVRLRANIYLSRLIVGILSDGRYRVRLSINSVGSLAKSIVLLPVRS